MNNTNSNEALRLLQEQYQFPCAYTFKIIGTNTPEFERAVHQVFETHTDRQTCQYQTKLSAHQKHQSISVTCTVTSAEHVLQLYAELSGISGLAYLL